MSFLQRNGLYLFLGLLPLTIGFVAWKYRQQKGKQAGPPSAQMVADAEKSLTSQEKPVATAIRNSNKRKRVRRPQTTEEVQG